MNKYDQFSIAHLVSLLSFNKDNMRVINPKTADIISWTHLKEVIEYCNLKNLKKRGREAQA